MTVSTDPRVADLSDVDVVAPMEQPKGLAQYAGDTITLLGVEVREGKGYATFADAAGMLHEQPAPLRFVQRHAWRFEQAARQGRKIGIRGVLSVVVKTITLEPVKEAADAS